jgi:hypothetical protein
LGLFDGGCRRKHSVPVAFEHIQSDQRPFFFPDTLPCRPSPHPTNLQIFNTTRPTGATQTPTEHKTPIRQHPNKVRNRSNELLCPFTNRSLTFTNPRLLLHFRHSEPRQRRPRPFQGPKAVDTPSPVRITSLLNSHKSYLPPCDPPSPRI